MTVNGPFTIAGGVFNAPGGTLSVSGAITHTAGGTFNAGGGTVALIGGAATIDVGTSETLNNLTLTAGTKTVAAGDDADRHRHARRSPAEPSTPAPWRRRAPITRPRRTAAGRHPADQRRRGADVHRRRDDGGRQPARRHHQQAVGHAHPGRHDPDARATGRTPPGRSTPGPRPWSSPAARSPAPTRSMRSTSGPPRRSPPGRPSPPPAPQPSPPAASTDGHPRGPGRRQPGRRLRRRGGHAARQRRRRPDPDRVPPRPRAATCRRYHQQAVGHAHAGRHDPDHQQLDLYRRHARPGHLARRLRGRRTITGTHTLNDVDFNGGTPTYPLAAGTTLTAAGTLTPDRRQPQHRHRGGPGRHQSGLDVRRRQRHAAHQRDRRADLHRRRDDGRRQPAQPGHQQAVGTLTPGRHDPHRRTTGPTPPARSTRARSLVVFAGDT